jgi:hypothetical protein
MKEYKQRKIYERDGKSIYVRYFGQHPSERQYVGECQRVYNSENIK